MNAQPATPTPVPASAQPMIDAAAADTKAAEKRALQEARLNGQSTKAAKAPKPVKPEPKPRAPRGLARDQRKAAAIAAAAKPKAVKPAELNPTRAAEAKRTAERKATKGPKNPAGGKRAALLEAAQRGVLPDAPDFSAETHKRWRGKLTDVIALVKAGDVKALKAMAIPTYSSSPQAIARYRDLAVVALEAKAAKAKG